MYPKHTQYWKEEVQPVGRSFKPVWSVEKDDTTTVVMLKFHCYKES